MFLLAPTTAAAADPMSTACTSEIALCCPWRPFCLSLELLLAAPLASVGAAPAGVLCEEHDGEMATFVVLPLRSSKGSRPNASPPLATP